MKLIYINFFQVTLSLVKKSINLLIIVAVFTASCTREIEVNQNNLINNTTSVTGNFILTKYTGNNEGGIELTGYVFSFSVDGKITVVKNNQTSIGTYTETYYYNGNPEKLGLYFSNKPLSFLNRSWYINFISDAAIHLTDTSSGDMLEFTAQ